ncbi:MAG: hypothetical protein ACJA2W_003638 [Planctomycetota bacterium]|jgi:hypothetical protein
MRRAHRSEPTEEKPIEEARAATTVQPATPYDGYQGLDARLGSQNIEVGNQRFIGTAPRRQNRQSFEGRCPWIWTCSGSLP